MELKEPMSGKKKIKIDTGKVTSDPEISEKDTEKKSTGESEKKGSLEELERKLAAAETEAKESYDRLLRASAELENYKKRKQKEIADFRKFANESLIKETQEENSKAIFLAIFEKNGRR